MRRAWILVVVSLFAATLAAGPSQTPPPQTFRASTDVVFVDAFVRSGADLVKGLTAADFLVEDNGVKQKIDNVEVTAVPIDLTLVADESGEPNGTWNPDFNVAKRTAALDLELHRAAGLLRPDDRLRLLMMDTYTSEAVSLRGPGDLPALHDVVMGGRTSLYDTLVAALLQPVDPSRRHVIVARTKGVDNFSTLPIDAVRTAADRSDALLYLVMMEGAFDDDHAVSTFRCMGIGLCQPTRLFWRPVAVRASLSGPDHLLTPSGKTLAESAELTGGRLLQTSVLTEPSLVGTFQKAFESFRQSYVLRYVPQGVKREGWHDIRVTVPSLPKAKIQARRGYAFDTPPAAPPVTAGTARAGGAAILSSVEELRDAYEAGAYGAVELALRQPNRIASFVRDFHALGNVWPAKPHREAVLALELAEAALFSGREDARVEALSLLKDENLLVRDQWSPGEFERYFLWAELALLQGAARPAQAEPFLTNALERFPGEPRFVLAKAIVQDQYWPVGTTYDPRANAGRIVVQGTGPVTTATLRLPPNTEQRRRVIESYEAAAAVEGTATEARVRLALYLHRTGEHEKALVTLDDVTGDANTDTYVKYLRELIRGRTLLTSGKTDAAAQAFTRGLEIWPAAQSARVGLMNTALVGGDPGTANQFAELIQTAPPTNDPWWTYWQGDYRFFKSLIARLRSQVK